MLLAVAVLVAVGWAVAARWDQVWVTLARVDGGALALSLALALLALVFTLIGWRALMADLGSPLAPGPASGVLFVGQLGKYLPGSVWSVVVQAEVAAALGVPRRRTAVAGLLSVVLSAFAGLGIGLVALPELLRTGGRLYLLVLLLVPVGLVGLHPRVLDAVIGWLLRLLRREPLEHRLSGRAIATTMASYLVAWLCLGGHVWVLVRDLGANPSDAVVPAVFGYALAASVGMVAVLVPAGVGVREGILLLLLTGPLDPSAALAVVVLSRFLVTASDVLAAGVGWMYDRKHQLIGIRRSQRPRVAGAGGKSPRAAEGTSTRGAGTGVDRTEVDDTSS
ncbi:MAG: lysylphosphatidylglycerol synthase domain-containing protein [Angustibacter sp.]